MTNSYLTIKDFVRIKELPNSGSILISSLDFSVMTIDLLKFIVEELKETKTADVKIINTLLRRDILTWHNSKIWFTEVHHNDNIDWYDYFSINANSPIRGIYHSQKFNI